MVTQSQNGSLQLLVRIRTTTAINLEKSESDLMMAAVRHKAAEI